MNKVKSLLITGILFLLNVTITNASVMAIDYGSQWYKVSLITPKIPLEIVLNEESQRKTRSIISIIDDERMFSNDAVSKSTKNPKQTFDFLKLLVGKKINDDEIKFYKSIFDIDIIEDHSRNSILVKSGNETYTVEELISYQLSKAKLIAENMSSGKLVDKAVITVPRFFNQYERLAMVNAAEIAGIKVLSVLNEDTAVLCIFDMGASCTTITLVSMKSVFTPDEKAKKSPEVQIHEFSFDKTLGGLAFDRELQLLIVNKIKKSLNNSEDIEKDPKIMAKILIKARKAKEILSVNIDTNIYFDSLINDQDINIKITKEEFEKASENLVKRTREVVESFFKSIKISRDNISSIILVGGSTRVPMVQNVLKDFVGESKLANYVNSDEAIVMGAGFQSAHLSQEFKVRTLFVQDIHSSSCISYEYILSDGKKVSNNLFNEKDPLTKQVNISLKTFENFDVSLNYGCKSDEKQLIFKAKISGIKEVIEENAIKEKKIPKVTLNFALSNSDIAFISNASVKAKVPINHRESLLEKFLKLINKPHWYKNRTVDKYKPDDLPPNAPKNFDVIKSQLPLNQMINKYDIYPLTGTIKKEAIDRKKAMDKKDSERVEIEVQKNNLESLIYKGREILTEQEETENENKIVLSEEEIKTYKEQLKDLFENLFENGQVTKINLEEIKNKISSVDKIVSLVKERKESIISRKKGIKKLEKVIKDTRTFYEALDNIAESKDIKVEKEKTKKENIKIEEEESLITEAKKNENENNNSEEITEKESKTNESKVSNMEKIVSEKAKELCNSAEEWLNEVVKKQSLLKNWDTPAFSDKDIDNKISEIYNNVTKVLNEFTNNNNNNNSNKEKAETKMENASLNENNKDDNNKIVNENEANNSKNTENDKENNHDEL
ncbi:actin-like ATPase domain-containing protein [Neocallimastix californiae]|uniref:Actin-like ATPase domain-containing protein n=1 Tax=Neocallimastix californiae TaxID=1754190 RepID=A0A1Y2AS53_9FUNG|nr:actin-like ATPase domain-containing protein [Neocallimastix californiae]|eukprot:ORY25393.1 actin-like ATPase domain-containing protein [Neocallimastix californiae]